MKAFIWFALIFLSGLFFVIFAQEGLGFGHNTWFFIHKTQLLIAIGFFWVVDVIALILKYNPPK